MSTSNDRLHSRAYVKFGVSLVIGGVLLYYTLRVFDINATVASIKHARMDYLIGAFLFLILAYLLRGRRWMVWEKDLKYWDSFRIILVGFMGNNVLPARLGELLRAHCAANKTNDNFGRTVALASIVIERVLDGFVISLIGIACLSLTPIDKHLLGPLIVVCGVFFVLTAGLLVSIFFHQRIRNFVEATNKRFPGHLTRFGKERVNYFLDGLLLIRSFDRMAQALAATGAIWGIELVMYYLIGRAVFANFPLSTSLLFLSVVNFASLFPLTVGGIGAIEMATIIYLVSAGIPASDSLGMGLILHGYQFSFTTLLGALFYFTSRFYAIPIEQTNRARATETLAIREDQHDVVEDTRGKLDELSDALGTQRKLKDTIHLSIVLPAYNERSRLPKTVLETIVWCHHNVPSYEVIIADDGSSDDTVEIGKLFSEYDRNIKVLCCPHLGKGATVRMGMLNAAGQYVLFMDADGATPLTEIHKLMAKIDDGYSVAIGSRVTQLPGETIVKTSLHRRIIGRTFAALVNIFAIEGIADTQCGFKIFDKNATREIFSRQKINGFAFDVEILYLARSLGFSFVEIPINWVNQSGSKVNLVTDSIKMLWDILRIRYLHRNTVEFTASRVHYRTLSQH